MLSLRQKFKKHLKKKHSNYKHCWNMNHVSWVWQTFCLVVFILSSRHGGFLGKKNEKREKQTIILLYIQSSLHAIAVFLSINLSSWLNNRDGSGWTSVWRFVYQKEICFLFCFKEVMASSLNISEMQSTFKIVVLKIWNLHIQDFSAGSFQCFMLWILLTHTLLF